MKYPRTPHLPWSPGASVDDVRLEGLDGFEGEEVVVTEKLDGENTTLYRDGLHARSMDSAHHPSRTWVKALHARTHRLEGLRRLAEASGRGTWDATSLTRQQRDLPLRVARERGVAVRLACVLTPRELAQARNQRRARTVPPEVVERQWRRVRWPYAHEATWVVDHGPDGEVL